MIRSEHYISRGGLIVGDSVVDNSRATVRKTSVPGEHDLAHSGRLQHLKICWRGWNYYDHGASTIIGNLRIAVSINSVHSHNNSITLNKVERCRNQNCVGNPALGLSDYGKRFAIAIRLFLRVRAIFFAYFDSVRCYW